MNQKKLIIGGLIGIVLVIAIVVTFLMQNQTKAVSEEEQTEVKQATVENQTMIKEFSGSLEVSSGLTEKVELHATYYFSALLVEENVFVAEGTNLLKYKNGTYLTAPYDLIITNTSLPEEDAMCTNSHYIEVQTTETLSANIEISESDMEYITLGKEVEVVINAYPETTYKGYVTTISETATDSKFTATVTFMNDGTMKLGMSGYCTITLQEVKDVISVPVEAVFVRADNTKYVIVAGEEVTIETGIANSDYVQITSGLELGQTIQYGGEL